MRSHPMSTLAGAVIGAVAEIARAIPAPTGTRASLRFPAGPGRRFAGTDEGMATTEYAIATVAAAGFAGLLVVILRSAEVRGLLTGLVRSALTL